MTYTPDGQLATLTAVNAVTGDQTTRYVYGSTLASSYVARSDLLVAEIYPDSDDSTYDDGNDALPDRIEYTYNRQGQRKSRKDQNGTLRGFLFDKLGRLVHDYVEVLAPGVDGRVRRITRAYGCAGRLISISAYTHPCARTGGVVNQLVMGYNDHGLLSAEYQSHSGPVDMLATPKVQYGYDDTAASGEFVKGLRPTRVVYPSGRIVRYEYGDVTSSSSSSSSSGAAAPDPDDCLNRVKFIAEDDEGEVGTHLAEYQYLGLGAIVTEDYPEPGVKLDYTPDGYSGFDGFGRVIDHRWRKYTTGEDLDRYQYTHDRAGNRTSRRNATTTERDEHYLYDGLYRLVRADRGNLDPAMQRIAGTPERQESWSLDATGNWSRHTERESGRVTQDQSRQHNRANELLSFSAAIGDPWSNPAHDRNGNMTRIPKPANPRELLNLRWDAWDRLVKVTDPIGLVAAYEYDGRNFRIASHTYRDPAEPDTVLDSPLTRHFYHNTRWQVLEERTGDLPSLPSLHYIWSLRYIDAPILRDRRLLSSPTTLSERLYYLGDANFNVTALVSPAGAVEERYTYTPYGLVAIFNPAWSATRASSAFDNTVLFTGRQFDGATRDYYHRKRQYSSALGRFHRRDAVGYYGDDLGLYGYCANNPIVRVDPWGDKFIVEIRVSPDGRPRSFDLLATEQALQSLMDNAGVKVGVIVSNGQHKAQDLGWQYVTHCYCSKYRWSWINPAAYVAIVLHDIPVVVFRSPVGYNHNVHFNVGLRPVASSSVSETGSVGTVVWPDHATHQLESSNLTPTATMWANILAHEVFSIGILGHRDSDETPLARGEASTTTPVPISPKEAAALNRAFGN